MERTSPADVPAPVAKSHGGSASAASSVSVAARCSYHPYFVSIRSSFNGGYIHRCGGVLVAEDTVLTAAHCVDGTQGDFEPILIIEAYDREGDESCNADSDVQYFLSPSLVLIRLFDRLARCLRSECTQDGPRVNTQDQWETGEMWRC